MDRVNHIEMRNISVAFGDVSVLNQVDFRLDGGSVHALTGANGAGKSTLMAVLCGSYDHYQGDIYLNGERLSLRTPGDAKRAGIHLVQQEVDSGLIPGLSVGENIMLDRLAEPGHFYNWQSVYRQASQALAQLNVAIDIKKPIEQCSLAEKQQILLARALTHHCRFLILDEPTAPLDEQESTRLFNVVSKLQQAGIGIVFISHRIHELKAVCDRMTVLRDGKRVESCPMGMLSGEQIVEKMLGHTLDNLYPAKRPAFSEHILLDVTGLHDEKCLKDINLRLHSGEIIGIAGLVGAGKTELCKALFGASASTLTRGELNGRPWRPTDPADAVSDGIVLVPEERRKEGIFIDESLTMNLSICADKQFSRAGFFSIKQATHWAQEIIRRLAIKTHGPAQTLRRLSGGNQQKAAIGKWLRSHADILIFDEPTKGIDIKAKTDLFVLIDELARQGKGIIYASGEFAELTGLCDRIYVLWDGQIVAELAGSQATEETLLLYSTGGSPT